MGCDASCLKVTFMIIGLAQCHCFNSATSAYMYIYNNFAAQQLSASESGAGRAQLLSGPDNEFLLAESSLQALCLTALN